MRHNLVAIYSISAIIRFFRIRKILPLYKTRYKKHEADCCHQKHYVQNGIFSLEITAAFSFGFAGSDVTVAAPKCKMAISCRNSGQLHQGVLSPWSLSAVETPSIIWLSCFHAAMKLGHHPFNRSDFY